MGYVYVTCSPIASEVDVDVVSVSNEVTVSMVVMLKVVLLKTHTGKL